MTVIVSVISFLTLYLTVDLPPFFLLSLLFFFVPFFFSLEFCDAAFCTIVPVFSCVIDFGVPWFGSVLSFSSISSIVAVSLSALKLNLLINLIFKESDLF